MLNLLKEVGMMGCRSKRTLIEANHRLGACVESKLVDKS